MCMLTIGVVASLYIYLSCVLVTLISLYCVFVMYKCVQSGLFFFLYYIYLLYEPVVNAKSR